MSKKQNYKKYISQKSTNEPCKNCGNLLKIKSYKKLPTKLLKKSYYFSEWKYCWKCNSVFFEEKNKVFLTKEMKEKIERDFHGKRFAPNPTASLFQKEKKLFNSMYREMKLKEESFMKNL